jgi:3-hydroxybutyryl-CoA dehydrogenase
MLEASPLAQGLVTTSGSLSEAVAGADFVFEAVPEKLELKQAIFADLLHCTSPECTLASNTSVIPISRIAAGLPDGERIIGTHWWNPPYLVPLVEVVSGERSASHRVDAMMTLLASVGKKPVRIRKDVPGFVGNRLQHALWREAQALVSDGVCDAETVDDVVKNSFGMRLAVLGPIENADLVGLDLTLDIHRTIIPELSTTTRPNRLLQELVQQGQLGFKTGAGFRSWTPEQIASVREGLLKHLKRAVRESR